MAVTFNISDAPLTPAEIAAEREKAEQGLAGLRKIDIRFIVIGAILIVSFLCFQILVTAPAVSDPSMNPGIVGLIALYTPYLIGVCFFFGLTMHHKMVENPRKAFRTTLDELEEATPEDITEIIKPDQHHDEITAYQQQVAAQGRSLLKGELEAIERWLRKRKSDA